MLHASQLKNEKVAQGNLAQHPPHLDITHLHGSLNEYQAKNLFSAFGISGVKEFVVSSTNPDLGAAKALGDKVVLKILSNHITHKTEVGGVALNVPSDDILQKMQAMAADVKSKSGFTIDEFLVQEMVSGGVEMMVGMHCDPLGTAVLVGMGGVTAELFKDTHMRLISPGRAFSEDEALEMLQSLKTWPLLDGYRGRPKCDVPSLVKAIVQFSELVACLDDCLIECEINPLFVFPEGKGIKAADGIAVFS
jgi:succinyl-CoA synthetase beta subunit